MKKYIITALSIVIVIIAFWLLNLTGVISLRSWGESLITSTPFLKEYVQTNQAYQELNARLENRVDSYARLQEEFARVEEELIEVRKTLKAREETITTIGEELAELRAERYNQEERLEKLVNIYSQMEPEDAARIFSTLDEGLVTQLLMGLEDEQAARILSALSPEEAAAYSQSIRE